MDSLTKACSVSEDAVAKAGRIILDPELFCGIVQTGGYFIDRIHPNVRFLTFSLEENECVSIEVGGRQYNLVFRPYYKEFLEFCFANYDVAIMTALPGNLAHTIVDKLFTREQKDSLSSFKCCDHYDTDCKQNSIYLQELYNDTEDSNVVIFLGAKYRVLNYDEYKATWRPAECIYTAHIKKLGHNLSYCNYMWRYSRENTLICDHVAVRVREAGEKNALIFPKFTGDVNEIVLLDMMTEIPRRLTLLKQK